jgi:hypothetical protein
MSVERQTCPSCGQLTIIPLAKDELAEITVCENSQCRVGVNKEGSIIGRWTTGYTEFVRGTENAHV